MDSNYLPVTYSVKTQQIGLYGITVQYKKINYSRKDASDTARDKNRTS